MALDEFRISNFLDTKLIRNDPENGLITDYSFQSQKINTILHNSFTFDLKQAGLNMGQCVDIYGVDERTLNSIDMEFYYEKEHLKDPLGTGANYEAEDISTMMYALEEHSTYDDFEYDRKGVVSDRIKWSSDDKVHRKETIYNIAVAECLRGTVFNEIGDIVTICIKYRSEEDSFSQLNNIVQTKKTQAKNMCLRKVRGRIVATSKKIPGFFKFSGYK